MRFKLDENLPEEAADLLRVAGHDATTVLGQRMSGSPDAVLADVCRQEIRILVTLDLDFADIRVYPPGDYPGLIVLRPASHAKLRILHLLAQLGEHISTESPEGRLWIVDEAGIRIR